MSKYDTVIWKCDECGLKRDTGDRWDQQFFDDLDHPPHHWTEVEKGIHHCDACVKRIAIQKELKMSKEFWKNFSPDFFED